VIDVALTRAESRPADLVIVIDVLRATSTVTQALASGYDRVLCAESIERASGLRSPERILAGERRCIKPPTFDQGNSPLEAARCHGAELVLATTNGAPAIVAAAEQAPRVLLACLLNLGAVIALVRHEHREADIDVLLVCAGTEGGVALEDVYVAGLISGRLPGARTDAALVAEGVARAFATPLRALDASAGARALRAADLAGDISYCARLSELDVVAEVVARSAGVAVVAAATPSAGNARLDVGANDGNTVGV
jgi:2-phosphosulfolactate phosphatase